jgi:hypothetical protein
MRTLALTFIALVLGAGCSRVGLGDTVDLDWNWAPLLGPSDELHLPYVAGADFDLYTRFVDEDDQVGWTLESDDASVLRIDSTENGDASVTATGAGTTTVRILDEEGELVYDTPVDVRQATRAELLAHGAMIIGRPEMQESWDEIRVLAGGSATFEVQWYDGDERLYGNGALTAVATGDILVEPRRTFLFEDREWVTFTPGSVGTYDVELRANGVAVRTVRVIAVAEDAVDSVSLHGMDESAAGEGDVLTVLAQAYDAEGRAIFGTEYSWDLDGIAQEGLGDLFRYELVPGDFRMLQAHGVMDAAVMIQATEGWVDSTNNLGCTVSPGVPANGALSLLALGAAAIALARRRKR